jgi:hypothetical protein
VTALFVLLAFVVNGFGRRIAGGLLAQWLGQDIGTQTGRAIQACLMASTVALVAAAGLVATPLPGWLPFLIGLATFAGATWGFPTWQLRWPPVNFKVSNMVPKNFGETLSLSLNGWIAVFPVAFLVTAVGLAASAIVAAGLARGPLFWFADAWTPRWRWMGFEKWAEDQKRWILQPTALTEFYSGGVFGAAMVLALVFG